MTSNIRLGLDLIFIIISLLPLGIALFRLIGAKIHNQRMINLADRAAIIVDALDQTKLDNPERRDRAMQKLSEYATEVGIKVTPDQVEDYIESAVRLIRKFGD